MADPLPRIEIAPFGDAATLRAAVGAAVDQLRPPATLLDPVFEVCGHAATVVLAVEVDGRLCLCLPYRTGEAVQVEQVVVAARTAANFLPWIRRIFPDAAIGDAPPRPVVVVAERLEPEVVELVARIAGGSCYTYLPVRVAGERVVLLRPAGAPLPPFRTGPESAWDHLDAEEERVLFGG